MLFPLLLLAVQAAQPTPTVTPPPRPPRGLLRADTDGDGVVTRAEAQAAADAQFARLDTNRDGVLSGEEWGGRRGPRGHDGPPPGPDGAAPPPPPATALTAAHFRDRALARFDRMDADRDGRVDAAEMAARRGPTRPAE